MAVTRDAVRPAGRPAAITYSGRAARPRCIAIAWVAARLVVLATPTMGRPVCEWRSHHGAAISLYETTGKLA